MPVLAKTNTSASERWELLRDTVYNTALSTFGKRKGKTKDWFGAHSKEEKH